MSDVSALQLDDTMGALMIGVLFAGCLWGVTCAQTFFYFTHCREDPIYLKLIVGLVWALDTTHQMLISHSIYYYVISNYFDPAALNTITPSIVVEVEINAVVAFVVQSFFVWRIWKLSKGNYYASVPTAVVAFAGFIVSTTYVAKAFTLNGFNELPKVRTLSALINVFSAVTDVLVAAVMVYLLHNSRSGIERSDNIINRLLLFIINSGLLTSICAVCSLIAVLCAPMKFIYICFFFTLGRLYTNSLLATLNARGSLKSDSSNSQPPMCLKDVPGAKVARVRSLAAINKPKRHPTMTGISINIESTTTHDLDAESQSFKHEGLESRGESPLP